MNNVISTDPISNFGLDSRVSNGRALLMCGDCNEPVAYHTEDGYATEYNECFTTRDEFPRDQYDYFLHATNGVTSMTLFMDLTGNPANIEALINGVEYDGITYRIEDSIDYYDNGSSEADAIERWYDRNPKERTHALNYWYASSAESGILTGFYADNHPNRIESNLDLEPEVRNAYVEANSGFTSRVVLDELLTKKYQEYLMNIFRDRKGNIRVGSITFSFTSTTVTAECVRDTCVYKDPITGDYRKCHMTVNLDCDRDVMEAFIYHCIKHGNNHAANFIVTRDTFYKLHNVACDTNCGNNEKPCNSNRKVVDTNLDNELNEVEFLMEHQRYCTESACACTERIAELLTPSFVKELENVA